MSLRRFRFTADSLRLRAWLTRSSSVCAIALAFVAPAVAGASEKAAPSAADLEFFESKIRPVLVKHCYQCHSAESKSLKAGLRLDSAPGMRKGGDSGPAVVPGNVEESQLLAAIRHESTEMPPSGKLPDSVIEDFTKWVRIGAPDPRTESADGAAVAAAKPFDMTAARTFWSFQRPVASRPAEVKRVDWARSPIDRFILAGMEQKGLKPVKSAGKRELIRRATFDLIGLPPTPGEIDAFLADDSPTAFDRVIERLLASPHYGERWGRYWLDVARYAEDQAHTFAVVPNTSGYRYRDWVVRSLNSDLPYDRFIKLQIAGDLMPEGKQAPYDGRIALGFFGLGAQYYKNSDAAKAIADELDDRVDTLTRGFLGLTVSCARCHDHKFDPIPTQDYYSLAGVFHSTKLANLPLVTDERVKAFEQQVERLKSADYARKSLIADAKAERTRTAIDRLDTYLIAAWKIKERLQGGAKVSFTETAATDQLDPVFLERSVQWLSTQGGIPRQVSALRESWKTLSSPDRSLAGSEVPTTIAQAARTVRDETRRLTSQGVVSKARPIVDIDIDLQGAGRIWLVVGDAGDGNSSDWADWIEPTFIGPAGQKKLTELRWRNAKTGFGEARVGKNAGGGPLRVADQTFSDGIGTHSPSVIVYDVPPGYTRFRARGGIDRGGADQTENGATVQFLVTTKQPDLSNGGLSVFKAIDAPAAELVKRLVGDGGVFSVSDDSAVKSLSKDSFKRMKELQGEIERLKEATRTSYPISHAIAEATPTDLKVYIRGNPAQQGAVAPRRFLRAIAGDNPSPFHDGSGRAELADSIANGDNPLTARVMVNRIWQNHFGRGIVGTSSNFGAMGERPTHPELLDYLARRFVDSGWSIKTLHREIMRSATYQLSTDFDAANFQIDGDNRLLWRANRRRLDVEAWRDSFLAVSGRLDLTVGGPSLELSSPGNTRRTLYAKISRHKLDALLRLFDFPDPNITSDKRSLTTVPQQQLFVLNSPFVVDQAKALAARLQSENDDSARIRLAYRLAYSRPAESEEVDLGLAFLRTTDERSAPETPAGLTRWERYAQVLLSSNEFLYLD